jgi:hypothetical protein
LDAIKFNLFGTKIKATALFTLTLANEWLLAVQLKNLMSQFKRCAVMLDATDTATFAAYELARGLDLPVVDARKILGIFKKSDGTPVKDTGDLTFSQLRSAEQSILEELT